MRILNRRRLAWLAGALALGAAGLVSPAALAAAGPAAGHAGGLAAAGPLNWSSAVNPERPPYATGTSIAALSCPTSRMCVGFDARGNVLTSTDPTGGATAWHVQLRVIKSVDGVPALTCLAGKPVLCVGVDEGKPVTSTDPTGGVGSWHQRPAAITLESMSCPSRSFCIGAGLGGFEYSTDPTGSASTWHGVRIGQAKHPHPYQVSCPTRSFCAAIDGLDGHVLTSTDPTGGPAAWKVTDLLPNGRVTMGAIACPSKSLCVASDSVGDMFTSTNPGGGVETWHRVALNYLVLRLTCPSTTECLGQTGNQLVTTTDPTGGASAWHAGTVAWIPYDFSGPGMNYKPLTCASARLCVGGNYAGVIAVTTDAGGGASTWRPPVSVDGTNSISTVACPAASFCAAGDTQGNVLTSTDPAAGKWKVTFIDRGRPSWSPPGITAIVCPVSSLCVAADRGGDLLASADPAGGASAWKTTDVNPVPASSEIEELQCPGASLCAAYNLESDQVDVSADPAGGASAWQVITLPVAHNFHLTTLDCPTAMLCVAADSAGEIFSSTDPASGASAWHMVAPEDASGAAITAMACAPAAKTVCAGAIPSNAPAHPYELITSADPTGGAGAWQVITLPDTQPVSTLACPSTSLCFAIGSDYAKQHPSVVWYSTHPAGGVSTWFERVTNVGTGVPFTCVSARLCIGPWSSGNASATGVITSTSPAAKNGWTVTQLKPSAPGYVVNAVGCASVKFCVAGDGRGDLFTGRAG